LATVISHKLIEQNIAKPKMQILIYPILQFFDFSLPSYRLNLPKRVLGNIDHENFKNFIHYFTGYEVDDTIFFNGHTSSWHKDEYSKFVSIDYLPLHLRNHSQNDVKLLNSTIAMSEELSKILLSKEVSPLLVDDEYLFMHTPANTYLLTTEMDILRDDGFIYANRLRSIGKNIEHKHYDSVFHGIMGLLHGPLEFRLSHILLKECADFVNSIIHN
jgi:acetyl esterase/lipase